jgi:hypothetical protein
MTDTPKHIQDLQLKMWLSKSPGERLYQAIMDNDIMLKGLIEAKKNLGISFGELDLKHKVLPKK